MELNQFPEQLRRIIGEAFESVHGFPLKWADSVNVEPEGEHYLVMANGTTLDKVYELVFDSKGSIIPKCMR
ncbi:hypothetical protein RCJ22_15575 [Vibrio sp. FNV 38]|nr:hypothetical protein [Vibrio sp. FNV 38]